jgi:hypothetical protein
MSPKPVRPPKPTRGAKERTPLERVLDGDRPLPPSDLVVQFTGEAPGPEALKALQIDDPTTLKFIGVLAERAPEIAQRLSDDRELAVLLATDPVTALQKLDLPKEIVELASKTPLRESLKQYGGVQWHFGDKLATTAGAAPSAATVAAVQLLADTFASVAGDAHAEATLRTAPLPLVTAAATAHPPAGLGASATAAASVVQEVADALIGAAGPSSGSSSPGGTIGWHVPIHLAGTQTVRIPTPRGL